MKLNSVERRNAWTLLILKGNFLHNCHVLKEKKGILLVLRRPDANNEPVEPHEYIPCVYCLGFIQKPQAFKHVKTCIQIKLTKCDEDIPENHRSSRVMTHSKILLHQMVNPNDNKEWIEVYSKFKQDHVKLYILGDDTLCHWGKNLTTRLGIEQAKHIRCRLRLVGTYFLKYHKHCGNKDYTVKDILKPSNYNNIFNVAQVAFGTSLTPPAKLGNYLKELIQILKHNAIFVSDTESKNQLDNLQSVLENNWSLISAPAIRSLKAKKPLVVNMPVTEDIRIFLQYLTSEITEYTRNLKHSKTNENFTKLNKLLLAYLIVFNRRREGEVSQVYLETYTEKPDYASLETDTIRDTLTPMEQYLSQSYYYLSTRGKKDRRVPIIYPALIHDALQTLVQNRENCGIHSGNKYLFPNSVDNHIRGSDVLRELVSKCNSKHPLEKPLRIRSTILRKHVATVAQILGGGVIGRCYGE